MFSHFFFELSHLSSFIIFSILLLFFTMDKDIGCFYKNNQLELSTPILKKPALSYSASHTSSTHTSISSRLDNKHIITNHNKNNTSNKDDIQSCVTPRKQITMFMPHLQPLIWRHWILHCILYILSYTQQINYPPPVKNICVFRLTKQ